MNGGGGGRCMDAFDEGILLGIAVSLVGLGLGLRVSPEVGAVPVLWIGGRAAWSRWLR